MVRHRVPEIFELHTEHGLHVHPLTNRRIDVNKVRTFAARAGWGRIHVKRMPKSDASYLAKYLSKERPPALKRWRLWAGFGGGWAWTRVANIQVDSLRATVHRAAAAEFNWKGNKAFREKALMVDQLVERTILEGWTPGLGPGDRPYSACTSTELLGQAR